MPTMKDLAPEIFRQRLLMEARWTIDVDAELVRGYLLGLAAELGLTPYGDPIVFSPAAGQGRPENAGFDSFLPLINSGISGYFWTEQRFLSVVLYSCTAFDPDAAVAFTKGYFAIQGRIACSVF
jgi:S-adenosylmethionine decarboxylase